eukprot:1227516-Prymnesium_polylepis.1
MRDKASTYDLEGASPGPGAVRSLRWGAEWLAGCRWIRRAEEALSATRHQPVGHRRVDPA